jgi:isopenicillin-N epimerase
VNETAAPSPEAFRSDFLLDPDVVFLNHGSFGACPRPVFAAYQAWQAESERQPVAFYARRLPALVREAAAVLGAYVNAPAPDLVFLPNATAGVNVVARSLTLQAGDAILTTDHEYGACLYTWQHVCQASGARLLVQPLPLPCTDDAAIIEALFAGVTPRTRAVFVSHITSPTALVLPVAGIITRARALGLLTIVDGAHVPGHVPLDLTALDADYYIGNLHKWLGAPKGAAFLYAKPEHQRALIPSVISWGCVPNEPFDSGSFARRFDWQGTREYAAVLSVGHAIAYQRDHAWAAVSERCHALAVHAGQRLTAALDEVGMPASVLGDAAHLAQMVAVGVPDTDIDALKTHLYDAHRIEVPVIRWRDRVIVRVSCACYTRPLEIERLAQALAACLADAAHT